MILSAGISLQRKVVHYQEDVAQLLTTAKVISLSTVTTQFALLTGGFQVDQKPFRKHHFFVTKSLQECLLGTGDVPQLAESLPRIQEALGSTSSSVI